MIQSGFNAWNCAALHESKVTLKSVNEASTLRSANKVRDVDIC